MTSSDPNGSDGPTPKNWVSLYIQEAENLAASRLPLETIPRSARPVIRKWIDSNITEEELALVSIYLDWEINWIDQILDTWTGNDTEILRAVDALLYAVSRRPRNGLTEITRVFNDSSPSVARKMSDILQAIPSVWQINRNQKGLERKIDSANSSALVLATSVAEKSTVSHLTTAWSALLEMVPRPSDAVSEAIKAVEVELHTIVAPEDKRFSLTKARKQIVEKPHKWTVGLRLQDEPHERVDTLSSMLRVLTEFQSDRHGKKKLRRPSLEEARGAVSLATALVIMIHNGVIQLAANSEIEVEYKSSE